MERYVINSAVVPAENAGMYEYRNIDWEEAKEWLQRGTYISTIGYKDTAEYLHSMTGMRFKVNIETIHFNEGDEALVCRLRQRVERGMKGKFTPDDVEYEIGILRRIPEKYVIPRQNDVDGDLNKIKLLCKRVEQEWERVSNMVNTWGME